MKLKDRNAIITGGNRGFGLAVAEAFIREGASVVICGRDQARLAMVKEDLHLRCQGGQSVYVRAADVSKEKDVIQLLEFSQEKLGRLDILVNNAGIYGPKGRVDIVNSTEWIKAIEINLFGVFWGCKHSIPYFQKNHYGKIINLSGGGATAPFPNISAYAASKAAIVRFTETIAQEYINEGIDVNAVAPGAMNTRMLDEVLKAGSVLVGEKFYQKVLQQKKNGGAPLERGAALCVYLASAESDGITGKLISAIWDPWEKMNEVKETLMSSDVYTLRRIVPEDRKLNWEGLK